MMPGLHVFSVSVPVFSRFAAPQSKTYLFTMIGDSLIVSVSVRVMCVGDQASSHPCNTIYKHIR